MFKTLSAGGFGRRKALSRWLKENRCESPESMNPQDNCGGFHHAEVLVFINHKMTRHVKGPEFYFENLSLPWEEIEGKLKTILEDNRLPSEAKEACAWASLALGIRFVCRQSHARGHRVQWLHDFPKLQKLAAQTLAAEVQELTGQLELERKVAAFQIKLLQTSLTEVQKERDQMKWKLLIAELRKAQELANAAQARPRRKGLEGRKADAAWPCMPTSAGAVS
ncbi:testis-expressed protein 13B-like [Tenrec ecaudatus]|uniref:testis-expressed protein 13B-like n=1 Tax=Tenrec ecaudatus TaxID=94439 RepID=UPI003F5ADA2E